MVRVNCSNKTSEFFSRIEEIKIVALKKDGKFWQYYMGTVIGNCAFIPYGNYIEIYEADEWKYGIEEEKND